MHLVNRVNILFKFNMGVTITSDWCTYVL